MMVADFRAVVAILWFCPPIDRLVVINLSGTAHGEVQIKQERFQFFSE